MAEDFRLLGLGEFKAGIDKLLVQMEAATSEAVVLAAHEVEAAAKIEATGAARWRNGKNFPRDGGPGVVTGTLRRSITVLGPMRIGLGSFRALVGPTVVYGRAVELGLARWRHQGGYPYMRPGLEKALAGRVPAIFRNRWAAAWR